MHLDELSLLDILHAACSIRQFIEGYSKDQFLEDYKTESAVVRQIEIIGEATKRVSNEFRQAHPNIPWQQMAGMRDRLIHGYDTVDYPLVWNVAANEVPELIAQLELLAPQESE